MCCCCPIGDTAWGILDVRCCVLLLFMWSSEHLDFGRVQVADRAFATVVVQLRRQCPRNSPNFWVRRHVNVLESDLTMKTSENLFYSSRFSNAKKNGESLCKIEKNQEKWRWRFVGDKVREENEMGGEGGDDCGRRRRRWVTTVKLLFSLDFVLRGWDWDVALGMGEEIIVAFFLFYFLIINVSFHPFQFCQN